jgi:hypothetical protein
MRLRLGVALALGVVVLLAWMLAKGSPSHVVPATRDRVPHTQSRAAPSAVRSEARAQTVTRGHSSSPEERTQRDPLDAQIPTDASSPATRARRRNHHGLVEPLMPGDF